MSFFLNRGEYRINDQETFELKFGFVYDNEKNFKTDLQPRFKIDFRDFSRNRYLPNDAILKYYQAKGEIWGGLQTITWGVAESFNPTDIINRRDFEDNYYDPEKLGEVIGGFKYGWNQAGPFDSLTLTFMVLPFFQEAPLPEDDTRFPLTGSIGGIPYSLFEDQDKMGTPQSVGGAFEISATVKNVDLSFHFYHGPERNPGFQLIIDDNGALRLQPFYYLIDMIGFNLEAPVGNFVLRFEGAGKIMSFNDPRPHDIPFEDNNAVPSNHLQLVPGFDYTFTDFAGKGTMRFIFEYLGEIDHSTSLRDFRPFKNDLFVGFQYDFNNTRSTQLKLGVIKDLVNQEAMMKFEFDTKIYRELKFAIEGVFVHRDSTLQNSPISFFDNNSYLLGRFSYAFGERVEVK
ncbi:MAG: hypothetical protein HY541_01010 [Deltaproteobacteria bacterium]|nr:hypothetical protein [Deltaproteobacteria bacterium]